MRWEIGNMRIDYARRSASNPGVMAGVALALALAAYRMVARRRTPHPTASQESPAGVPKEGSQRAWRKVASRIARDIWEKNLSFLAAGAAFNTFLAITAGIAVLISLSILIFGADIVQARLGTVQHLVPAYLMKLLSDPHSRKTLGIGLLISVGIDLWTVLSGSACMLTALTLVYGEKNKRSFFHRQLATFALAAIMVPFGLVSLALIAILPGVIGSLEVSWLAKTFISAIRWPILVALFMGMLAAIYRHAPHRAERHWQWASWGAVIATALWIAGSAGFSFYMSEFLPRDQSYGALGTVMLLLAWLDATAFIVLLRAQINSEIEQERQIV